jgi:hypothetical protein
VASFVDRRSENAAVEPTSDRLITSFEDMSVVSAVEIGERVNAIRVAAEDEDAFRARQPCHELEPLRHSRAVLHERELRPAPRSSSPRNFADCNRD